MRIAILAGGEGRRIGGHKPQRRLGIRPLLDYALEFAHSVTDDVLIVGGRGSDLQDDQAIEGPLGGLAAALALGGEVLTIPCDMPFLPVDLPERLRSDAAVTVAASGGRLHPVCALWTRRALGALPAYVATGRRSLMGFAEAIGFRAVEWSTEPLDPFFNINDEGDLARAEEMLRNIPSLRA